MSFAAVAQVLTRAYRRLSELDGVTTHADAAQWDESKHPRASNGQFGNGSGTPKKSESMKPDPTKFNPSRAAYIKKKLDEVAKALTSADPLAALKKIEVKEGHGKTKAYIDQLIAEQDEGFADFKLKPNVKVAQELGLSLTPAPATSPAYDKVKTAKAELENEMKDDEKSKNFYGKKVALLEHFAAHNDPLLGFQKPLEPSSNSPPSLYAYNKVLAAIQSAAGMGSSGQSMSSATEVTKNAKASLVASLTDDQIKPNIKIYFESKIVHLEKLAKENPGELTHQMPIVAHANSSGAEYAYNKYLAAVQSEASQKQGFKSTPPTPPSPTPQVQAEIYQAVKKAPVKHIEQVSFHEDAHGREVKAKLLVNTKKIPGDFYARVTAANGRPPNAMSTAVDKEMQEYAATILPSLPQAAQSAIASYRGNGYKAINQALLDRSKAGDSTKAKIDHIRKAIQSSVIPADTPVFRGLNANLKQLSGFEDPADAVGRVFEHKSFASVSRSESTATGFGVHTLMKVTMPAGSNGLVMGGQGYTGGPPIEREILLDANSMFRIDSVEEQLTWNKTKRHIIHCTYMGSRAE